MCPPPASGKGGRPMTRTREISGSGQIFALLVLSQCFWLLCCRPSLVNGLLSMAASAVAYGVVFLLAIFCRRCAARGETPLSPVFAAWGALLAVGYFAVTAEQLLSAARVLFEGVFSPLLLLLVLLGTHILKTKYISEACDYLIDNMSVFFIPAGVAIMGCFSMLEAAAAKFAFVCIATTVIVFLATSYTVLFVSWIMAKLDKDTALAPAVEAENAAKAQAGSTDSNSTHAEGAGKHHPHTPGGAFGTVAGKEA